MESSSEKGLDYGLIQGRVSHEQLIANQREIVAYYQNQVIEGKDCLRELGESLSQLAGMINLSIHPRMHLGHDLAASRPYVERCY